MPRSALHLDKIIPTAALIVLSCQAADFIIFHNSSYILNDQTFFGSWLGNASAIVASLLIVGMVLIFFKRLPLIPTTIFVSASLSNVIDRIFYGGVIDYFHLWHIPTFNLADMLICLSLVLVFARLFWSEIKKRPVVNT